jgi:microcystin-dependent protein
VITVRLAWATGQLRSFHDPLQLKPLRTAPNTELLAGTIIQGTPYVAVFNNSDGAFYLQGFFGNPFNIPLAGGIDYWGTTVPNSCFAFPFGQPISRTTYAALFALIGTAYGSGDGSTTFNLPDKRGRVSAAQDAMGGTPMGRISTATLSGTSIGASGGAETHVLTVSEMPSHSHVAHSSDSGHSHSGEVDSGRAANAGVVGESGGLHYSQSGGTTGVASAIITTTIDSQGDGGAHTNMQPTILCNYIIRIL